MDIQKVVLLCRSENQEQLKIQRNHLLNVAQDNNWAVVAVIIEKRNGISRRRFRLRLAMYLAQKHSAAILVEDISRVARDTSVAVEYAKQLRCRDIKLISAKDGGKADQVPSILQLAMVNKMVAFG